MILSRRDGQTPPPDPDPWLTAGEVARLLRVSGPTVYRLIAAGELQAKRIRRSIRIRRSWVRAYLRAHRVTELPARPADGQPRPPPTRTRPSLPGKAHTFHHDRLSSPNPRRGPSPP